jgi:NAD(P)-dependent dehydrogenase (short-subunit alcohol dehydrogenase family)
MTAVTQASARPGRVVTRAGNGIGEACTALLVRHGASVVMNDPGTDEYAVGKSLSTTTKRSAYSRVGCSRSSSAVRLCSVAARPAYPGRQTDEG